MPFAIGRLVVAAILALGALPSLAQARGAGAAFAPSVQAGPGMGRGAVAPFGGPVAPRSAVIVAPRQRVVVAPGHARNVVIVTQQQRVVIAARPRVAVSRRPIFVAPQQPVLVVPQPFLVVPQQPVFFVPVPPPCVWCDELGCVRQTLDFCATFAGP
jgi:hypothetical protein